MSALMEKVHTSLEELEALVEKTTDPLEKEGLKAFIDCVTPHLIQDAQVSFLGKIAMIMEADIDNANSEEDILEALGDKFEIEIE